MKTIFISSTFRDMHYERDVIKTKVEPELNDHARSYGETAFLKDLRWGISTEGFKESQAEIKVLRSCLEEIDHSRPYMVILLGDRYGTIFEKEQVREAIQGYQNFSEEDLSKSIMGLEIEYGALNRECWKDGEKPKALFYFRRLEGDFPKEYQDKEGVEEQKSLENLKERIRNEFGPEQVHEYCLRFKNKKPSKKSLDAFAERVREDIQVLFQAEWEEKARWSETERELDRHWDYARQKGEQFQGREDLLLDCCEKLEEGISVFAIKGASGTGKSTLLGKLAVELEQKGKTVVPLFCGTTDQMTTASDVMIFLIDYIAEHLGLPTWKQRMEENNPTSKQFGLSMQMEELEEFSEKQLFEKELASKTDNSSLLQEVFREYVLRYNEEAQRTTIIFVDAIDQLAKDELRDKLSFLPNLLLYGNREKEKEEKGSQTIDGEGTLCLGKETPSKQSPKLQMVLSFLEEESYRFITPPPSLKVLKIGTLEKEEEKRAVLKGILAYYHRELSEQVHSKILKKASSNNPLYLSLVIQRLLMMDGEEFGSIEEGKQIDRYQIDIVDNLPNQLKGLVLNIVDSAKSKTEVDSTLVEETMGYLCTSRYGLREQDLQKLFEQKGTPWIPAEFSLLRRYIRNLFIQRGDGRIDFSHKIIREAMREGRVEEEKKKLHRDLAQLLIKGCPLEDKIRQEEVIYHCQRAREGGLFLEHLFQMEGCKEEETYFTIAGQKVYETALEDQGVWMMELLERWKQEEAGKKLSVVLKLIHEYYPDAQTKREQELFEKILLAAIDLGESLQIRAKKDTEEEFSISEELASCYKQMGWFYFKKGSAQDYSKAKEYYLRSIRCYEGREDPKGASNSAFLLLLLALLYQTIGGESYIKAEELYGRSLKLYKEVYQKLRTTESKKDVANAFANIGYLYKEIGGEENYHKAEKVYQKSLDLREEVYQEVGTLESKGRLANAYFNLGDLYKEIGGEENCHKAEEQYQRGLKLRGEIDQELGTTESKSRLANAYFSLGDLYKEIGGEENYHKAEEQYQRSLKLQEEVYQKLRTAESKGDIAFFCFLLGSLYQIMGGEENYSKSENQYQRSLKLREEVYQELGTTESKQSVADSCSNIGYLYEMIGGEENYRKAEKQYQRGLTLREEVYQELRTSESKGELATACFNLGDLYERIGEEENYRKAEEQYQRSLMLREEVYQELGTTESKKDVAYACFSLGDLYQTIGGKENYIKSEEQYQRSLSLQEEIDQQLKTSESKGYVASSYFILGNLYKKIGGEESYIKAEEQYQRGLKLQEELYQELGTTESEDKLATACFRLGRLYQTIGGGANYHKAKEIYQRSLKLYEEVYWKLETPVSKQDVAAVCFHLGCLYQTIGGEENYIKSEEQYQRSLTLYQEIYQELGTEESKGDVAFVYFILGELYETVGGEENYHKAEEQYQMDLRLREELCQEFGTAESKDKLATACFHLGYLYQTIGGEENYIRAEKLLQRSLKLQEEVDQELGASESRGTIAIVCFNLGDLYLTMGGEENYPKSEELLLRSLDLYQELGTEENKEKISKVFKILGDLYEAMGDPEKAEQYRLLSDQGEF